MSTLNVFNATGVVTEGGEGRMDGMGSAFLASIPGFLNVTIGASNVNALAPNYAQCTACISFTNGLRPPIEPGASNSALHIVYTYTIGDGATWTVQGRLNITMSTPFGNNADLLGNPYQTVVNVTGTRTYTYLPTNSRTVSTVYTLPHSMGYGDQRFYPYSLLSSSPGVYTSNAAPFWDSAGVEFGLSPAAPVNGDAPGTAQVVNATSLFVFPMPSQALLTEKFYRTLPSMAVQQQTYALSVAA